MDVQGLCVALGMGHLVFHSFQCSNDVDVTVMFFKSEEVDLEDLNPGIAPACTNTGPCLISV